MTIAKSGRHLDELTLDRVRSGELVVDDIRIHPDTLRRQADVAEQAGNPQLAENLRRAAEMTALDDDEVMNLYEALRPGRCSEAELRRHATDLRDRGLPLCADLVTEAAEVYARRGLTP